MARRISYGDVEVDELARRLIVGVGNWAFEAANRLIAEDRTWLEVPEFYRFLYLGAQGGEEVAYVDWKELARALEAGEIQGREGDREDREADLYVLRMGTSITGWSDVYLYLAVENQSLRTITAMMRAIAAASGELEDLDKICPLSE